MTTEAKNLPAEKLETHPQVERQEDRPIYQPATDIAETETAVLIQCDLPGVDESRVDITLEDRVLTITAAQEDDPQEGFECLYRGYGTGVFERSFRVNAEVDRDRIEARMKAGVLMLRLPKSEAALPKKIEVLTEG